jgi:hypothetical protein
MGVGVLFEEIALENGWRGLVAVRSQIPSCWP